MKKTGNKYLDAIIVIAFLVLIGIIFFAWQDKHNEINSEEEPKQVVEELTEKHVPSVDSEVVSKLNVQEKVGVVVALKRGMSSSEFISSLNLPEEDLGNIHINYPSEDFFEATITKKALEKLKAHKEVYSITIPFIATLNSDEGKLEEIDYCEKHEDCIIVSESCCGCNMGGKTTTINKKYSNYWERERLGEKCGDMGCPCVMSQHISCFSEPRCINATCQLVPNKDWVCSSLLFENCKIQVRSYHFKTKWEKLHPKDGISCKEVMEFCAPFDSHDFPFYIDEGLAKRIYSGEKVEVNINLKQGNSANEIISSLNLTKKDLEVLRISPWDSYIQAKITNVVLKKLKDHKGIISVVEPKVFHLV